MQVSLQKKQKPRFEKTVIRSVGNNLCGAGGIGDFRTSFTYNTIFTSGNLPLHEVVANQTQVAAAAQASGPVHQFVPFQGRNSNETENKNHHPSMGDYDYHNDFCHRQDICQSYAWRHCHSCYNSPSDEKNPQEEHIK